MRRSAAAGKFGPLIAANLKRWRQNPSPRWHLDEMVCTIKGERLYLWRAVDDEGVVLDLVMQRGRDKDAALKLLRKLLHNQPVKPELITTEGLRSYGAALDELKLRHLHRPGRLREKNRAENSHLSIRRRERKQQGFKSRTSPNDFLTMHAAVYNNFFHRATSQQPGLHAPAQRASCARTDDRSCVERRLLRAERPRRRRSSKRGEDGTPSSWSGYLRGHQDPPFHG